VRRAPTDSSADPNFAFVTATFAIDGIVDTKSNTLKIEPMLKAFAGVPPPHTVQGFTIDFENISPSTATLQRYSVPGVLQAEGRYTDQPPMKGLEYRIKLLTQDPAKVVMPDQFSPKPPSVPAKKPAEKNNSVLLIGVFVIAGLAAGALVYFALLRAGTKNPT
jgi:hypothetical protein